MPSSGTTTSIGSALVSIPPASQRVLSSGSPSPLSAVASWVMNRTLLLSSSAITIITQKSLLNVAIVHLPII